METVAGSCTSKVKSAADKAIVNEFTTAEQAAIDQALEDIGAIGAPSESFGSLVLLGNDPIPLSAEPVSLMPAVSPIVVIDVAVIGIRAQSTVVGDKPP